jgi:hypothetical protein
MSRPHTFKVIDNVYFVMRRSYFTCSYLVDTPTGLVAIDAGMKSTGAEMLSAISELGRKVTDVSAIRIGTTITRPALQFWLSYRARKSFTPPTKRPI